MIVKCKSCGFEDSIGKFEPTASVYSDICCPNCKSTNNDHNAEYLRKLQDTMKEVDDRPSPAEPKRTWKDCPDCQHTVFSDEEHICRVSPAEPKCERCGLVIGVYRGCRCSNGTCKRCDGFGTIPANDDAGRPAMICDHRPPTTEPAESEGKGKNCTRCDPSHRHGYRSWIDTAMCLENGCPCSDYQPPSPEPSSVEDARAFVTEAARKGWSVIKTTTAYAEQYATKHLERQTPAIERAAVEKAFERLRMMMGPRPADNTVRASIATILEEYGETE